MQILKANTYRLEPTEAQQIAFSQWAGACRFVYNLALEQRREYARHRITYNQQQSELTALRAEYEWLKAVPVHALQMSVRALDNAFQRFFTGLGAYPKPHKKGQKDRFSLPDPSYLGFKRFNSKHGAIKVPKVGWVKLCGYRPLGGELRSITIKRKGGYWYASIVWRKEIAEPAPSTMPLVGIDRGVTVFAAMSNGVMVAPLNAFRNIEGKIVKAQRKLARKIKFSANWKKQAAKILRLHEKAANARKDYLHKLSTQIAKNHGIIKIEKLRVKNMTASAKGTVESPGRNVHQKSGLNKSILDQGWSMFAKFLKYKAAERGGVVIEVPAPYTSQTCPKCGSVNAAHRKSQSLFECIDCGYSANADYVGSVNISRADSAVEPLKRTLKRVGRRKHQEGGDNVAA